MNTKRIALQVSAVAAALMLGAAIPSVIGDAPIPLWKGVAHWAQRHVAHYQGVASQGLSAAEAYLVAEFGFDGERRPVSAPEAGQRNDLFGPPSLATSVAALGLDPTGLQVALAAYRAGSLAEGDAAARQVPDALVRTALEWLAIRRFQPHEIGWARLQRFAAANPQWPARGWLMRRAEEAMLGATANPTVRAYFLTSTPQTLAGKLMKARILETAGRITDAARLIEGVWRTSDVPAPFEARIKAEFGLYITPADHKYRADRLLYKEQVEPALRAAAAAGPDVLALAKARAAVVGNNANDATFTALPPAMQADPAAMFAQIQKLRRADRIVDAVALMMSAPGTSESLVNGDEWWTERRLLARKMLDLGDARTAYILCAEHSAVTPEIRIEAEFHAGWIALRFLGDSALAAPHFATAASLAETPLSISRTAYWQGRAAEASLADDARDRSQAFYRKAAAYGTTYYGQIARERLVQPLPEPALRAAATGAARDPATRIVELFDRIGEAEFGANLAVDAARTVADIGQAEALAAVVEREHDAHLSLTVGKLMSHRGLMVTAAAYPTDGVPPYEPVRNSAEKAVVLAVARQESAFDPRVVSGVGARGLMQMMPATAKRTAELAGLPFDETRLLSDPAFNAQLGAAHLGTLIGENGGSYVMTFAAYNAGGGRVKQWVAAYGNPTRPGVDPIDWVERIPFTETRNYVQRCIENLIVYRRLQDPTAIAGRESALRQQANL